MRSPRVALRAAVIAIVLAMLSGHGVSPQTLPPPTGSGPGCQRSAFRVALDIGHYTAAPGAISARGFTEFTYNRKLGQAALIALRAAGFGETLLIGESGDPMPLTRRSRIARDEHADLFVSLHHDSVQKQHFSEWIVNDRKQWYSDTFHGYSIFVSATSRQAAESKTFATLLGRDLRVLGLTPSLHHAEPIPGEGRVLLDPYLGIYRFDELAVLRGATMPALLLESAIIVNRDEEREILSGAYHAKVVAALVAAISQYCDRR
jgi:N-acetylmuramoyl-L-alanine amidase